MLDDYSEKEVADLLKVTVECLQKRRATGKNHPPFRKFSREVTYPRKLFHEWTAKAIPIHRELAERGIEERRGRRRA